MYRWVCVLMKLCSIMSYSTIDSPSSFIFLAGQWTRFLHRNFGFHFFMQLNICQIYGPMGKISGNASHHTSTDMVPFEWGKTNHRTWWCWNSINCINRLRCRRRRQQQQQQQRIKSGADVNWLDTIAKPGSNLPSLRFGYTTERIPYLPLQFATVSFSRKCARLA